MTVLDDLLVPAGAGIAAGLGVAMPLGPIAALLLREGLVNGFRVSAAAATAVAAADTAYCAVAMVTGALLGPPLRGHRGLLLGISGALIVAIGLRQLVTALRRRTAEAPEVERRSPPAAFALFLGLTAANPLTLVYFLALAGAVTVRSGSWIAPVVFVAAVGLSSLAWQLVLAAVGSAFGGSLGPRATERIGIVASLVVIGLGAAVVASGAPPS